MKYYVYILECADGTFYIGWTNNLSKRVHAHNTYKSGAHYTKIRRPVVLQYTETYKTKRKALQREHALKQLTKKEKSTLVTYIKKPLLLGF
ncbi:MAG: GIY-YIG nuclease family protein [Patescibacteria group bacterium]